MLPPVTRVISFPLPGTRDEKGTPAQRKMYCPVFRQKGGGQSGFSCICCFSATSSSKQSYAQGGMSWSGILTSPAFLVQMRKLSPQGSTRGSPEPCRPVASLGLSPTLAVSALHRPCARHHEGIRTLLSPPAPSWAPQRPVLRICLFPLPAVGGGVSQSGNFAEPHPRTVTPAKRGRADGVQTRCVCSTPPCCVRTWLRY